MTFLIGSKRQGRGELKNPMDHLRGRRLSESARQLVSMCNGMAEMGLSYEAARLLKSTSVYSTNEETSKEAKVFLLINVTFFIARTINNAGIIDVFWGFSFGLLATYFSLTGVYKWGSGY